MKLGMFMAALLATATFGTAALAERHDEDSSSKSNRGRSIKEQVLEKQKNGFERTAARTTSVGARSSKIAGGQNKLAPRGEIYGDQASAGKRSVMSASGGRNLSASNAVNTPSEMKAMKKAINPMNGAYRVSEAAENTDSYGGSSPVPNGHGKGKKNLSATGLVNTPKEMDRFMGMMGHAQGTRSAAGDGTDSYGGARFWAPYSASQGRTHVHFVDAQGNVKGVIDSSAHDRAKGKELRAKVNKMVTDKLSKAKEKK